MKVYISMGYIEHIISKRKTCIKKRFKTLCGIKIFRDFAISEQKGLNATTNKLKKPCEKCKRKYQQRR